MFFTEKHNIQFKFYLLKTIELTYILDFIFKFGLGLFDLPAFYSLSLKQKANGPHRSLNWCDYIIMLIMKGKINYLLSEN